MNLLKTRKLKNVAVVPNFRSKRAVHCKIHNRASHCKIHHCK